MGLPGSGKTTFAEKLKNELIECGRSVSWYNADIVRQQFDDWDFSEQGRLRQADRMKQLSIQSIDDFVISDFIAPTNKIREFFNPDIIVFMDTINQSRFSDTDAIFESPSNYDFKITDYNYSINHIVCKLINDLH